MRLLTFLAALLATALSVAPSYARLVPVTEPVKWLNLFTSRTACTTCPNDTLYLNLSSSIVCSTVTVGVNRLVPAPVALASATGDTSQLVATLTLVADSTAAGTVTAATVNVQGVYATPASSTGPDAVSPGVTLYSKAWAFTSGSRVLSFPIYSTAVARGVGGSNTAQQPLLHSAWRITISSVTGVAGRVSAYLSYYIDE